MLLETEYFEKTHAQVRRFINQHSHAALSLQIKYRNNYLLTVFLLYNPLQLQEP